MTDRPILMSGKMVVATLREIKSPGTGKGETRRCVTKGTTTMDGGPWCNYVEPSAFKLDDAFVDRSYPDSPILKMPWDQLGHDVIARIRPRIEIGDRLWVRENWLAHSWASDCVTIRYAAQHRQVGWTDQIEQIPYPMGNKTAFKFYACKGPNVWRPSIHMPRWASRITLEVTDVQFERVRDITEGGAQREGVTECPIFSTTEVPEYSIHGETNVYPWRVGAFTELWDDLNEARGFGWDANPWVVVISFKPVLCNIDRIAA